MLEDLGKNGGLNQEQRPSTASFAAHQGKEVPYETVSRIISEIEVCLLWE